MAFGGRNGSMGVPGSTGLAQSGSGGRERRKREEKVNFELQQRETIQMWIYRHVVLCTESQICK